MVSNCIWHICQLQSHPRLHDHVVHNVTWSYLQNLTRCSFVKLHPARWSLTWSTADFCVVFGAQVKIGAFLCQHFSHTVHRAWHSSEWSKVLRHNEAKGRSVNVFFQAITSGKTLTSLKGHCLGKNNSFLFFPWSMRENKTRDKQFSPNKWRWI